MRWSFSGLKQFLNCPRQYHEVKVKKTYEVKVSQQMQYGTDVHKALEDYARDGTELPEFYRKFKPLVDALLAIPGEKYLEHKMALNENRLPCAFDASDYWVRGIADLLIVDGDRAFIVDYKTGSAKYPDSKQLKLMALMVFAEFPQVNTIKAGLLFVVHNAFITEDYKREQIPTLWLCFAQDLMRLSFAYERDHWHPTPSGLCPWCPVLECEHHNSRR